jgi:phospholipase/carboxylesterase
LYALTRQNDEAISWLRRSAELGFASHRLVTFDDDLANIRDRAEFAEAAARIAESYEKAIAAFKEEAPAPDPVVVLPAKYDPGEPAALVVALHGYGGTAPEMADVWREAAAEFDAIVIAPRAIRKVKGAGYSWGRVDEAEFLVLRAVAHVESRHQIDPKRIVLSGFSQGAVMSFAIGLRNPERFRGVIPVCGGWHPVYLKETDPSRTRLPRFFLMAGDRDGGTAQMRRAAADLEEFGATVKLVVYENMGHHFPPDRVGATRDVLKFVFADD